MARIHHKGEVNSNYVKAPKSLLASNLTPGAKVVYLHLLGHQEGFSVSQEWISQGTGMAVNSVRRAMDELENSGFVERRKGARNSYAAYTLRTDLVQNLKFELSEVEPSEVEPSEVEASEVDSSSYQKLIPPAIRSCSPQLSEVDTQIRRSTNKNKNNNNRGVEKSEENKVASFASYETDFQNFLAVYPSDRIRNIEETQKLFNEILSDGTDPHALIAATEAYYATEAGKQFKYNSDRFLRDGIWEKGKQEAQKTEMREKGKKSLATGRARAMALKQQQLNA